VPSALSAHLFDDLPVSRNHIDERAGGPGKGKEAGDADDGADETPRPLELHLSHSQCGVSVGAEIDGVVDALNKAEPVEEERPDEDLHNLEKEHEKDAPAEDECGAGEVRVMGEQAYPPSVLSHHDAVESGSMKQDDAHQNDGADHHRGKRLVVIRNLLQ